MLRDEKILITGPAGRIAFGLARSLAADNEVWGIARFGDAGSRGGGRGARGDHPRRRARRSDDFGDLPRDFTYLLHLAADFSDDDYDRALRVNAEGTGFLLEHCRSAKAALVMSTLTVYRPDPDPWHASREDDPLGDQKATHSAPYSVSKIAQEAVARYCARAVRAPDRDHPDGLGLRQPRRPPGDAPRRHRQWSAGPDPLGPDPLQPDPRRRHRRPGRTAPRRRQRAGHDRELVRRRGRERAGVERVPRGADRRGAGRRGEPVPCASVGSVGDPTRRISITGPCQVQWRDGFRRMAEHFHPDRLVG